MTLQPTEGLQKEEKGTWVRSECCCRPDEGMDRWATGATRWTTKDLFLTGILQSSVSKAVTARSLSLHMKYRHLVSVPLCVLNSLLYFWTVPLSS